MSLYTAFFVRFLHGVVDAFREAEAFVFHTRLAHVSASLRDRDVSARRRPAVADGARHRRRHEDRREPRHLQPWHASASINSRTAVIIVSDGYDTGEPERLGAEMRRLAPALPPHRLAQPADRLEGLCPEARGMQAALPYVDLFAPAHNLESLAALEPYLARI